MELLIELVTEVKLRSMGVGGSVQSICLEFLFDHRQRIVVDRASANKLLSFLVCHRVVFWVLFSSFCIPLELFDLV